MGGKGQQCPPEGQGLSSSGKAVPGSQDHLFHYTISRSHLERAQTTACTNTTHGFPCRLFANPDAPTIFL